MSTRKQPDVAKERFWRRMLRQWRKSGLSVRAFCRAQALSEPSFYSWRRTLSQRDAQGVAFVPVQVLPAEKEVRTDPGANSGLELLLGQGHILRVGPGFDAPTLQRLLAVLEEGRPC